MSVAVSLDRIGCVERGGLEMILIERGGIGGRYRLIRIKIVNGRERIYVFIGGLGIILLLCFVPGHTFWKEIGYRYRR